MTIIYQLFSRTATVGMLLVVLFFLFTIPPWRKAFFKVILILIALNLAGLFFSKQLKTTHMRAMESTQQRIKAVIAKSEFKSNSLAQRKYIWKRTLERIQRSNGLGTGPDSLMTDITYGFPTAHNLFLTLTAEYGLPGLMLISALLFLIAEGTYKSVFRKPKVKDNLWLLQAIFVAATLHALCEYSFDLPIHRKQLWFIMGLLIASINVASKDAKKNE